MHCIKDEISGVSECIIMGNLIPLGTGLFKLVYDDSVKQKSGKKEKVSIIFSKDDDDTKDEDKKLIFDTVYETTPMVF